MSKFHLEPADILVNLIVGDDPYSVVKRWALGAPYSHVFMYLGKVGILVNRYQRRILRFPMLFESNGRGAVVQALSNRYGQEVVVMRLISEHDRRRIGRVLEEAVKLASDERSYYDYYVIATHIIPQLILEKLHLPIPLRYQRNSAVVCSEACAEAEWRAGLNVLPKDVVPLPGDFVNSPLLCKVWSGVLEVNNAA